VGFATAAAGEFNAPLGAAESDEGQRGGRRRRDAPAGQRRRGLAYATLVSLRPMLPAADNERCDATCFGGQLQAAGGCQPEARNLCDNGSKAAVAQTLFEGGQNLGVSPRLAVEDPIGMETRTRERRGKEVAAP